MAITINCSMLTNLELIELEMNSSLNGYNNFTQCPSYQASGLENFREWYLIIHGYLSLVVCIFGIIANIANIIVLTR